MLLTAVVVGGLLLTASAIAGLLMLYQIRQSSDIINSSKAIFAADTGIEWELYKMFQDASYPQPIMTNQATFTTIVSGTSTIKSIGTFGKSSRAFELTF